MEWRRLAAQEFHDRMVARTQPWNLASELREPLVGFAMQRRYRYQELMDAFAELERIAPWDYVNTHYVASHLQGVRVEAYQELYRRIEAVPLPFVPDTTPIALRAAMQRLVDAAQSVAARIGWSPEQDSEPPGRWDWP